MLDPWYDKHPEIFKPFLELHKTWHKFNIYDLNSLLNLLEEKKILNTNFIKIILNINEELLPKIIEIVEKLTQNEILNKDNVLSILNENNLDDLCQALDRLEEHKLLNLEKFNLVIKTSHREICVDFLIDNLLNNYLYKPTNQDLLIFLNGLITNQSISGLKDAMTLFKNSSNIYNKDNLSQIKILSQLFTISLCQTILHKHLMLASNPNTLFIDQREVTKLIYKLSAVKNNSNRVEIFFDYVASYIEIPHSPKHIKDINIEIVTISVLEMYLFKLVESIDSKEKYTCLNKRLAAIEKVGGDQDLFENIKNDVANFIELNNWRPFLCYKSLTRIIWQAINKPLDLSNLKEPLEKVRKKFEFPNPIIIRTLKCGILMFKPSELHDPCLGTIKEKPKCGVIQTRGH